MHFSIPTPTFTIKSRVFSVISIFLLTRSRRRLQELKTIPKRITYVHVVKPWQRFGFDHLYTCPSKLAYKRAEFSNEQPRMGLARWPEFRIDAKMNSQCTTFEPYAAALRQFWRLWNFWNLQQT